MGLDGCFAGSDGIGYLFVRETGNDPRQQFSLARCQRFKALPQHYKFCLTLECGSIPFQCEVNRIQKILIAERLR